MKEGIKPSVSNASPMSEGSMVLRVSEPEEEPGKVTLSNGNLLIGEQSGYNLPLQDAMVWTLAWPALAAPNSE